MILLKDFQTKKFFYQENFEAFKESEFSENPFKVEDAECLIKIVKSRMLYPETLKIHKGVFPESAKDINEKFCFVNLDMDLYQPQLAGLKFFWSKMEKNGVVLFHDYFHPQLPGVKKAVMDFEKELGHTLAKVPIGDHCSIAVVKCD